MSHPCVARVQVLITVGMQYPPRHSYCIQILQNHYYIPTQILALAQSFLITNLDNYREMLCYYFCSPVGPSPDIRERSSSTNAPPMVSTFWSSSIGCGAVLRWDTLEKENKLKYDVSNV